MVEHNLLEFAILFDTIYVVVGMWAWSIFRLYIPEKPQTARKVALLWPCFLAGAMIQLFKIEVLTNEV